MKKLLIVLTTLVLVGNAEAESRLNRICYQYNCKKIWNGMYWTNYCSFRCVTRPDFYNPDE